MDMTSILAFILIFVVILSILIVIAYYGIKETKYDDLVKKTKQQQHQQQTANGEAGKSGKKSAKTTANGDVTTSKKDQKQQQQQQAKKQQQQQQQAQKKRKSSPPNETRSDEIEEEPIVIIPDPFTNQVSSRFAGATGASMKKPAPVVVEHVDNRHTESRSNKQHVNPVESVKQPVESNQTQILQQQQQQQRQKPKATVKPSQNIVSVNKKEPVEEKDTKLIKVNLVKTHTNDLISSNYESQINELSLKLKETNESLNEKLKQLDNLLKANTDIKNELAKYHTLNVKLTGDVDTLRQTNQVIQKELTKSTQKCMTLEKEKHIVEEKMRSELDSLKREQLTFSADNGKQQALEAQISYLQGEINQLNRALKEKEALAAKITSDLQLKDGNIIKLQADNKKYETEIADLTNKQMNILKTLQTQEALTKQLELQLEKSIPVAQYDAQIKLLKQKENDLNASKAEIQQMNKTIDELKQIINRNNDSEKNQQHELNKEFENLKNKITELESSKSSLVKELDAEKEQIKSLKTQLEQASTKQEPNTSSNDQQSSQVAQLEARVAEMESTLSEREQKLNEHIRRLVDKELELKKVQQKLEQTTNNFKELESSNITLNSLIVELKAKSINLEERVTQSPTKNDEQNKINDLVNQNEKLKLSNMNLRKTLEQLDDKLARLENGTEEL